MFLTPSDDPCLTKLGQVHWETEQDILAGQSTEGYQNINMWAAKVFAYVAAM